MDWDGEYVVRIGLPGERAAGRQAGHAGIWMDGKLLRREAGGNEAIEAGVLQSATQKKSFALSLPEGDHVFRVGFVNDDFVKGLSEKEAYNAKKNKYLELDHFRRTVSRQSRKASRKKILICDPNTGAGLRGQDHLDSGPPRLSPAGDQSRSGLAGRSSSTWRRPKAKATEQGIQLAIQAMLVSPHFLFRIERDPDPNDPAKVHQISDLELASRLSYFLWSSMPDDELLSLAEAGKLREPRVLDAQVKRMLADRRAPRPLPTTSPASGWRRAISTASSRIRRSSLSGDRNCAMR